MTSLSEVPSHEMTTRFFQAIASLKEDKVIPGIVYFLTSHDIPRTKMMNLKSEYEKSNPYSYNSIDIEVYFILSKDYNISLDWLFFGIGEMKKIYRLPKDAQVQR